MQGATIKTPVMKQQYKKLTFTYFFIVFVFGVIRLYITRFYIDPETNFYTSENFLLTFFDYLAAAIVVFLFVFFMFFNKKRINGVVYHKASENFIQGTQSVVFTASLTGFLLIFSAFLEAFFFITEASSTIDFMTYLKTFIKTNSFDCILFFLAIPSSVYFFKTAWLNPTYEELMEQNQQAAGFGEDNKSKKNSVSQAFIFFSFFPIIWSFVNVFKCFFDLSKSVNSTLRTYELICFLALSVYFVAESKLLFGTKHISKFFSSAFISVFLVVLSALPNLIVSSFWILETNNSRITYAVQISFCAYIISRIYSQIKYSNFLYKKPTE